MVSSLRILDSVTPHILSLAKGAKPAKHRMRTGATVNRPRELLPQRAAGAGHFLWPVWGGEDVNSESCSAKVLSRRLLAAGLLAQRRNGNLLLTGRPRLCLQDCTASELDVRALSWLEYRAAICCSRGGVRKQVRSTATAALPDTVVFSGTSVWTTFAARGTATKCMRAKACGRGALLFCPLKFHSARKKVCCRGRFFTVSWPGSFPVYWCHFGGGAFTFDDLALSACCLKPVPAQQS